MYMMWFDDSTKRPTAEKLQQGADAYRKHFGHGCNVVLVNEADKDAPAPEGVTVRSAGHVRRYNYWFGWEQFV